MSNTILVHSIYSGLPQCVSTAASLPFPPLPLRGTTSLTQIIQCHPCIRLYIQLLSTSAMATLFKAFEFGQACSVE